MVNKKEIKRKQYSTMIGEKLKNCLEKQKEKIKEVTYGVVDVSDYSAGEVLAQKIIDNKLL